MTTPPASPSARAGTAPPAHVVHVATRYYGGAMRRLLDVVDAVDARHTLVVGPGSDPERLEELAGRVDVVVVPTLRREVSPTADPRALVALVATLRRLRADVVHTHQAKAGLLGRVAARLARVPIVYHSASMASFGPGYGTAQSAVFQVAERATAPMVDRYYVVGSDLADRLASGARVPRRKLAVVRSAVDRRRFPAVDRVRRAAARAARDLAADEAVVVFVGSLDVRKGVDRLPEVLGRTGRAVTLLVAGTGPLRERLEEASVPDVDVRLLGHVGDVGDLMAAADVVVLPSSAEGVPQVLVQAAMVGVPFVAYDVDGVGEVIDLGAAGRAVPLGDEAALADAVAAVLDGDDGPSAGVPEPVWAAWSQDAIAAAYRDAYVEDLSSPKRLRRGRAAPSG